MAEFENSVESASRSDSSDTPIVSVILATHNRAEMLRGAIESLLMLEPPEGGYEVIVVDNGSTDDTAKVCQRFSSSPVPCKYIFEPRLGLSHARNAGVRAACGEIVVFFDDDEIASSGWLKHLTAPLIMGQKGVAGTGGPYHPVFDTDLPEWLPRSAFYVGLGSEPQEYPERSHPTGGNFACRKELLVGIGGLRPDLGRRGEDRLSFEEVDVVRRLRAQGYRFLYEPEAIIYHRIPAERLTQAHLLRDAFGNGRSSVMAHLGDIPTRKGRWTYLTTRIPYTMLYRIPVLWIRLLLLQTLDRPQKSFAVKMKLWSSFGYLRELINSLRQRPREDARVHALR